MRPRGPSLPQPLGAVDQFAQVVEHLVVATVVDRDLARRIRLTGERIDALSGSPVRAGRYDRVLEDIFAVQEELTRNIVRTIA